MALVVKDRVKETTATTGQGTLTLAGAVSGFQSFTSVLSNGDTTYYAIFETSTGQWEVGLGTFTATGTTLARTTILESSNAGSAINLTAGAADVFITQPAEKAVYLDSSDNVTFADNQKAIFGTGSDLQIYHDGSSSIIEDAGNGNLLLKTSNGANVQTYNANGNVTASFGTDTHLYYNGTERLRTTSTGANIYGTLDVDSTIRHIGDTNTLIGFFSDVIYFTTAGSQRMYINSSGDVGIGTNSPETTLEVKSTGSSVAGLNTHLLLSDETAMAANVGGGVLFEGNYTTGGDDAVFAGIKSLKENGTSGDYAGALAFYSRANGSLPAEAMRIDSSGNVGIGQTSPTLLFEVKGASSTEMGVISQSAFGTSSIYMGDIFDKDIGRIAYNNASNYMQLYTNNSEQMRIDSSGQVGIGTTSPSAKVHSVDSNGNVLRLQRDGAFTGSWDLSIGTQTTGDFTVYDNENSQRAITVEKLTGFSGTSAMYINSSGDVGIGTSDISGFGGTYKGLDVAYKGSGLAGRTDNPTFDMRSNLFFDGSNYKYGEGSTTAGILSVGGGQLIFSNAPSGTAGATATVTERMRIDSSGNVGIGQTSPGAKLDVNGVILGESLQGDYDALSGTTPAPDADNADAFSLKMTGNTTFTFGSVTSGRSVGFCLQLTGNGGTVTWPASVDWAGGTAPDAPGSGETDILVFWTRDGGTTWYGFLAGDAMA